MPSHFSKSVLDFEQISLFLSLRDEGEWETVLDIFVQFKEDVATRLDDMARALEEQDYAALSLAAHSVKGCAGTFGMRLVETLAGEIDIRARARSPGSGLAQLSKSLQGAWTLSLTELETLFAQHDAAEKAGRPVESSGLT